MEHEERDRGYKDGITILLVFQPPGFGSYEMSRKRFKPSPLGLGGGGGSLASSNLVSMELCRSDRRDCDWLIAAGCSFDPRDMDRGASSASRGEEREERERVASSERLDVLDSDSERRECRDVERSSRLLLLLLLLLWLLWLSHALPLRAGIKVVEEPLSGIENSGGGVSSCRSRVRRSSSSSILSPLSRRPSEGMMVVDAEVWRVELWVEFMESEKRRFLTVASSTPRRSQDTRPEGGRGRLDVEECLMRFSGSFSGSSPPGSD